MSVNFQIVYGCTKNCENKNCGSFCISSTYFNYYDFTAVLE